MKSRTSKRSRASHRDPCAWLGVGALTLGMGAALAGGTGVASADSTADSQTSSASSPLTGPTTNGSARGAAHRSGTHGATAKPSRATAHPTALTVNTSAPLPAVPAAAVSARASMLADEVSATRTAVRSALARREDSQAPSLQYPSVTYAPTAANLGPVLGAARWAINELQYQALGLAPVAKANQLPSIGSQTAVAGTFNTVGPFGNPVAFTITGQPSNGTVSVDANGFYVYQPDAEFVANGGTDTFTVTATDTAFHLENLLGQPGHSTTITVPVTVAAQATQGATAYYVTNTSYQSIQVAYYGVNEATLSPRVGTVLATGESAEFQIGNGKNVSVLFNPVGVSHEQVVQNIGVVSPDAVAISPDGKHLYVTSLDGNNPGAVKVIDTDTNLVSATIPVGAYPYGIATSPDGKNVYVANDGSGSVSIIDTATNTVTATIGVGKNPYSVAVTPDGTRVYVANKGSQSVSVINTATNAVTDTIPIQGVEETSYPSGIAISPDGEFVYTVDGQFYSISGPPRRSSVAVISTATNTQIDSIDLGGNTASIRAAVSSDGVTVYVANAHTNTVSVIDTQTNTVTGLVGGLGSSPVWLAINPDGGKLMYVTNAGGNTVSVISTDRTTPLFNTVVGTIAVGTTPQGVVTGPDGTKIFVAANGSNAVQAISVVTNSGTDHGTALYEVTMAGDSGTTCSASGISQCGSVDTTTFLLDPPGTEVYVPSEQAQQQSNVLQDAVTVDANNNPTNATYFPTTEPVIGYTNPLTPQGFSPYINNTKSPSTDTYSVAQTTTTASSTTWNVTVKTSAKGKMLGIEFSAEASASNTWGTTTTNSQTFTQSTTQTVLPGETLYLYTETPVQRFYGDWVVHYGNTTYNLHNVWYDTPYPADSIYRSFLAAYTCLTGSQQCAQVAAGDLSSYPPSFPPILPTWPVAESNPESSYNTSANAQRLRS